MKRTKKAVVLLSGGLDSATALYVVKAAGYKTYCPSFAYGQRHCKELRQAQRIARASDSPWSMVRFRMPWKGSALLDRAQALPSQTTNRVIPSTYVPARNIIFLSFAAAYAEVIPAEAIVIGANEIDYSGYPDCRKEFLTAFQTALQRGTKRGVEGRAVAILAPLVRKSKLQIIKTAVRLRVPLELTWSCYRGGKSPCGRCDSCRLRREGFRKAQLTDPAL